MYNLTSSTVLDIVDYNYGIANNYSALALQSYAMQLAAFSYLLPEWPKDAIVPDKSKFDFVIVGAGSAGSVLATRLTENPECNVLLIEAGGDPPLDSVVPGSVLNLPGSDFSWKYSTINDNVTAQEQKNPGRIAFPRGKMLGGSSSINLMLYVRCSPEDFKTWGDAGMEGWEWDNIFKYFLKSEGMLEEDILRDPIEKNLHNSQGPLKVSRAIWPDIVASKLETYIQAYDEIGIKRIKDYNGPTQFGASDSFFTHSKPPAVRSSTAVTYLVPAKDRPNLHIFKNAFATKILIKDGTAYGVQVVKNNKTFNFYANKEVILSVGTLNEPKLLLASGIGPKEDLDRLGIKVVADLPVGKNMSDHLAFPIILTGRSDLETNIETRIPPINLETSPFPNMVSFYDTTGNATRPNMQTISLYFGVSSPQLKIFCSGLLNFEDHLCKRLVEVNLVTELFVVYLLYLRPLSRGHIKTTSVDPSVDPEIYHGYFTDPADFPIVRDGIRRITNLTEASYFEAANSQVVDIGFKHCAGLEFLSDKYWDCFMVNSVNTLYHSTGTCAMGGVVNNNLQVYGVNKLRVIDASVYPNILTGNINAPTIMLAERMSDVLKMEYGYNVTDPLSNTDQAHQAGQCNSNL